MRRVSDVELAKGIGSSIKSLRTKPFKKAVQPKGKKSTPAKEQEKKATKPSKTSKPSKSERPAKNQIAIKPPKSKSTATSTNPFESYYQEREREVKSLNKKERKDSSGKSKF